MNITSQPQEQLNSVVALRSPLRPEGPEGTEPETGASSSDGALVFATGASGSEAAGERLTHEAFLQLSGNLAGYPFVKVVVDRREGAIHFIHHARFAFHADYIGQKLLGLSQAEVEAEIDEFNESVYLDPNRRFFLGIIALHQRESRRFYTLETVEIDTMDGDMVQAFFRTAKAFLDPAIPLLFKPANHGQERLVAAIAPGELPRVLNHELFASAHFVPLHPGRAVGRLRAFRTENDYRRSIQTLEWYDILVMHRVPDDIPRISGIINAHHTTPLSHTNVLASGWQIPNAIQIGIFDQIARDALDGKWVEYAVDLGDTAIRLKPVDRPEELAPKPAWSVQQIRLEEPEVTNVPIVALNELRMSDRYRYGTKAANLGELSQVLARGSQRLLGFYRVPRPPRANLLPHLARFLKLPETADLTRAAWEFLGANVRVPRGIAIPFALQQKFLESSPRIQQSIGKLKMALELGAREIDPLCLNLQKLIRATRFPEEVRGYIDEQIAVHLSGVSDFVVRSSSNAEDLAGFSAAGIYESINHVSTAETIFNGIKEVWASLLSPRSVRLRQEVGISLDDCYMGVIIQEQVGAQMGGVLVTTNPMNRADFRNVFVNVSPRSVTNIVQGAELPYQYLFNTVEGGGRTLSLGDATIDLSDRQKDVLQRLSFAGRLLQSHFSPDYTFSSPVDIEWISNGGGLHILQLRPYAK
jgi:hypothetical protein